MDPNQWAYNQAYRINAAGGIPTNPRFELPFMEQGTPQVQATAVHPSLAQSRGLGALPNYGHPAFGAVSQFLENMQLGTPIAGTTSGPYKTVTVGQPAYTLETPPRTTEQRIISTPSNPVTSISPPKTWELSSFIPSSTATSNPFSGLPQDLATFNSTLEPPPAHSRNPPSTRASTIQRNPYQKEYMDPPLLPVTAHSGVSRSNQGGYSSLAVEREPPVAHSHSNQFCSYGPQQISSGNSHQRSSHQSSHLTSHQTPMRSSSMTSNYPSSPQLAPPPQPQQHQQSVQETYSYGRGISNNTFVDTKLTSHIDTSPSLSYEAVSPAGTPTLTSDSVGRDTFTPMSLQDLADISSNQERLPLQRQQQSQTNTVTTWASSHNVHQLPKQQESQSALSSPHSHLGSPHMVVTEHSPLHQPSPNNHINVGSPQVGMPLGSPQSGSSSVNPPIVTAVPDSTTRPRKRSRKKKEEKPEVYESPVSIPQQPVFPCPDLAFSYNPKYTPMNFAPPPSTEVAPAPESIFMTNAFGNAFVNPNDAMGTSMSKVEGQMDYGDNMGMTPPKQTPPSPPPVAVKEEVDEEFAHLVTPAKSTSTTSSTTSTSKSDGKEEKSSPAGSTSSAFQNSFLSFLQGNKPETLSSVTNSNVQRPPMPKYVPDTRPIIPPEPKFRSRSDSFSPPPSKSRRPSTSSAKKSEMDVPSVTFSDDDEEEEGKVTKTVASFLDKTSGDESSSSSTSKPWSAGAQIARRGKGGIVKSKGRTPTVKRRKSGWDDDDDDDFNPVEEDGDDEGIIEVPKKQPKKKAKPPSPIPMRERPSRRAKEKVEEKRKAKEEKKKRRLYGGDSDSGSPLEESSGDEKPTEKDYDSDRDPVWRPNEIPNFIPVHNDSDDDGTGRKGRGKPGRRFRPLPSKASRNKVKINMGKPYGASQYSATASAPDEMAVQPVPEPVHQPSDDDEESVHRYMKGDFVIEKKDLTNYDSYPIWKIDAGRLIQKFEAIEQNGRTIHKALSTYSSWSDALKHQFKAIKVRILQVGRAVGSEQVEVLEQYRPQPSEGDDEEDDELMPFFNIYMQILISQALEPGFLAAINEEKDEYYHGPLKKIDSLIDQGVAELEKVINWKEIFKDHVILYPDCKVMDRGNVTIQCQVTRNVPAPVANQAILLAGEAYEAETLEPLPAKTQAKREYLCNKMSIKHLNTYHGLKHYRNATYQNCLSKVVALKDANKDLENRDLLDQCLQNRAWVQKMFRDLKTLTKKAMEKT